MFNAQRISCIRLTRKRMRKYKRKVSISHGIGNNQVVRVAARWL